LQFKISIKNKRAQALKIKIEFASLAFSKIYATQLFGLELKSVANQREYRKALSQAAQYGKQLGLTDIALILFVKAVDETNQKKYETDYIDSKTGVTVHPQFL
jgi:hypothetical protein